MGKRLFVLLAVLFLTASLTYGQNRIAVSSVSGKPGSEVKVSLTVSSDRPVAGIQFNLLFDQRCLEIKSAANGREVKTWNLIGLNAETVKEANKKGKLPVSLVDFSLNKPIAAGKDREVFVVTFFIKPGVAEKPLAIVLDNYSLADNQARDIVVEPMNGEVKVVKPAAAKGKP
jgi:hypothetical protein